MDHDLVCSFPHFWKGCVLLFPVVKFWAHFSCSLLQDVWSVTSTTMKSSHNIFSSIMFQLYWYIMKRNILDGTQVPRQPDTIIENNNDSYLPQVMPVDFRALKWDWLSCRRDVPFFLNVVWVLPQGVHWPSTSWKIHPFQMCFWDCLLPSDSLLQLEECCSVFLTWLLLGVHWI